MPVLSANLRVDGRSLILTAEIAWRTETETMLGWHLQVDMMEQDTKTDDFLYRQILPITPRRDGVMNETRAYSIPINASLGSEIGDEEVYAVLTMRPSDTGGALVVTDTTNVVSVDA